MKLVRVLLAVWCTVAVVVPSAIPAGSATDARPMYAEPAIAPDGSEVAFVSGGDIWSVPAAGGIARLLVASVGSASRPEYSPDGKRLAFTATKNGGAGDAYVLTLDTGDLKRLTFDDGRSEVSGWSHDGAYVYFTSSKNNVSGTTDVMRVPAAGGTPTVVVGETYYDQAQGVPSRDGALTAYKCGGFPQWWRRGHAHIDESAICTKKTGANAYTRVTPGDSVEQWPMWNADDKAIYYVSDRSGAANLWVQPVGGRGRALTQFTDGRVIYPSIDAAAKTIVFERNFGIWTYDTASGTAKPLAITRRGLPADVTPQHVTLATGFRDLALAPDGKKVAIVVRGQIFAASAAEGGDALRVTKTAANAQEPLWTSDSRHLVYLSDADGTDHLYEYDFLANTEKQLTSGPLADAYPQLSRDGKKLAYERNARELHVRDLATDADTIVARGYLPSRPPIAAHRPLAWSPAGDAIAYVANDARGFSTAHVARLDGAAEREVSFIANGSADDLAWSPDATRLYYVTSQRTEEAQVLQVDLVPRKPAFREDRFRDLFNEEPTRRTEPTPGPQASPRPSPSPALAFAPSPAPEASGPPRRTILDLDDIRERATFLPIGVDVDGIALAPDGKSLYLTATAAGQQNVYAFSLDELAREEPVAKQLTSSSGSKIALQIARDGKTAFFLDQGRVTQLALGDGRAKPVPIAAELDTDIANDKLEMFAQAWRATNDTFFDPKFNGVDWPAVRAAYEPYIRGARTYDDVRRLLNMMDGELNASHMGAGAPRTGRPTEGNLGVAFDDTAYERRGKLVVAALVHRGPLALTGAVKPGDTLVAIAGVPIGAHDNVDQLLENTIGKRTTLTFETPRGKRDVAVQPISDGEAGQLRYRDWVESRRAIVAKASGGRLGYVHIRDMSSDALTQLYTDLDTENQGREAVVVDIRDNNGGFIDPYVADVLQRKDYLRFNPRGGVASTGTRADLGQRALGRKTVLVTNEHSLSDAENFTEGYRALHLGKVVGEPTAGWIIFTYGTQLIDGTSYRLPNTAVTALDGGPLERHPRPVDVRVARPLGESAPDDAQLRAAVETLLRR